MRLEANTESQTAWPRGPGRCANPTDEAHDARAAMMTFSLDRLQNKSAQICLPPLPSSC